MKYFTLFVVFTCLLTVCRTVEEDDEGFSFLDHINSSPVVPTMLQYVVVPAVEAHGSYYLGNKPKEIVDNVSRWQTVVQNWAAKLSQIFQQFTEFKFDSCARKFLCSLGKAKYQSLKEQKRSTGSKIVDVLNSFFRLPTIEQKLNFTYLEAREFGAAGGNCEDKTLFSKCPISSSNFDQFFYIIKQLF